MSGSKLLILGDGHPTFKRKYHTRYIKPYCVDDHPRPQETNGSLDPFAHMNTYDITAHCSCSRDFLSLFSEFIFVRDRRHQAPRPGTTVTGTLGDPGDLGPNRVFFGGTEPMVWVY